MLQFGYSIWKRNDNRDLSGDPWNGRTLEWSTTSPAPEYNFATIPVVSDRDAFWARKQAGKSAAGRYEDITMANNTPMGMVIAGFALVLGFCVVWHIYWLAVIALVGALITAIVRLTDDRTEHVLPAVEVKRLEKARVT